MAVPRTLLLLGLFLLLAPWVSADGLKFDVRAMVELVRNGEPVLSPDKDHFAYTQTSYKKNESQSKYNVTNAPIISLVLQQVSGGDPTNICEDAVAPGNLAWFNEDILLFTAIGNNGKNQIWYYNDSTNNCNPLTEYEIDIDNLKISPTKNYVIFSAEVYYSMNFGETKAEHKRIEEQPYKAFLWTRPYVRHWDTWIEPNKWIHLFGAALTYTENDGVIEIEEGEPTDIMFEFESDAPLRPFGDRSQFDISPDGKTICFATQLGDERAWNTDDMLYLVPFDIEEEKGKRVGDPFCLTCSDNNYPYYKARASTPVFIDNDFLVFLGMEHEKSESDVAKLVSFDIKNMKYKVLTGDFDYSIGSIVLDRESVDDVNSTNPTYTLYLIVSETAREKIYRYKSSYTNPEVITSDGSVTGLNVASFEDHTLLLYSLSTFEFPAEIYAVDYYDEGERMRNIRNLSMANNATLNKYEIINHEEFYTISQQGERVHHYYFKPSNLDVNNPPPVIVLVHGGPESPWYDGWSYRWNPQVWVSEGYSLILTNYHGSDSFGHAFTEEILGDWFGLMYDDIKAGLKWMIDNKYADPTRIGTAGASFGCNTIFWILGHNDINSIVNVCHDGVFDPRMSATDTEELYFPIREFGGFVFDPEVREKYDEKNASLFVSNWETPTLVIHGGQDFRIPETHGLAAFQALRRQGVEAEFLYFPTQSHWVHQPVESIVWHDTVMAWLARHLQPEADASV